MGYDDYIINRKTQSVLDMGDGFHSFCGIAQRDLAWVTDRKLLVAVMTEALANWDCAKQPGHIFQHTVEWHAQLIWQFVQGAEPQDIEFTWHSGIEDWEAFDRLKTFYLYGGIRPDSCIRVDHFIVNHRTKSMLGLGKDY